MSLCILGEFANAALPVVIERITGESIKGQCLAGSMRQFVVQNKTDPQQSVPFESISVIRFETLKPTSIPSFASGAWIVLASGERIRAEPTVIDEDALMVKFSKLTTIAPLKIALESCRGVALTVSDDAFRQGIEWRRIQQRETESDLVALKNGDRVEGEFLGLADAKFKTKTTIGEVLSDYLAVRSVALNPSLITIPKRAKRAIWATLIDGSLLLFDDFNLKDEFVIAKSVSGFTLELPTAAFVELRCLHENAISLTELVPESVSLGTLVGTRRSPQMNRNVLGGPLCVSGIPSAMGIGVASGSRVNWLLSSEYQSFATAVGVDDCAGAGGTVEFEILVDDRSVWRSPKLHGRDALLRSPSISVKGAKRLSLVVHPADHGAVLDFADWVCPVLSKEKL